MHTSIGKYMISYMLTYPRSLKRCIIYQELITDKLIINHETALPHQLNEMEIVTECVSSELTMQYSLIRHNSNRYAH